MIRYHHVFPGLSEHVRRARRFVGDVLEDSPVADDAGLLTSELATNAVLHSRSGELGGTFNVTVELHEHSVRVEVTDQGPPTSSLSTPPPVVRGLRGLPQRHPRSTPYEDNGRGLFIVETLATRWGTSHAPGLHIVWFELDWKEKPEK